MADSPILHVSDTAFWVATYRAIETERPDALFKDPLASILVEGRGRQISSKMKGQKEVSWALVIRTCLIDDYITRAINEGVDMVLNLGAGLDTRPYRMKLPKDFSWVEVDFPEINEFKTERLKDHQPVCNLRRISLDLSDPGKRTALFAELNTQAKNVLVLTEGVTPYLSEADVASLAQALHQFPCFKYWVLDYFSKELIKISRGRGFRRQLKKAPFIFRPDDWFEFFKKQHWVVKELQYMGDYGRKLNRPAPVPWILRMILPKKTLQKFDRFTGFGMLEKENLMKKEIATLAGGCFWGMEDLIRKLPGVLETEVGYTGGHTNEATYERVKTGQTGHAESLQVTFDAEKLSFEQLLLYFFRIHDPTTEDQQGNDIGSQYRSAIFFHSQGQQEIAEKVIARINQSNAWGKKIATEVSPAVTFHRAEEYHQDYLVKHPNGYTCHFERKVDF